MLGDQVVDHFVDAARRDGCSWAQIGSVLGVSRQGAQQRYGGAHATRATRRAPRPVPGDAVRARCPARRRRGAGSRTAMAHDHVDTEHLLLGLLSAGPDAAGTAVLTACGLDRAGVEREVTTVVGPARIPRDATSRSHRRAKKALELSLREALALRAQRIGTEHLLLALLRERKGIAARVLAEHGDRPRPCSRRDAIARRRRAGGGMTSHADLPVAEFGFPGPLRDRLVAAILRGEKTSTTGLHEEYVREGDADRRGRRPRAGRRLRRTRRRRDRDDRGRGEADGRRRPRLRDEEGEGFETLDEWRDAHVGFFTSPEMVALLGDPPVAIDDDTLVVCSRFRLVERLEQRG